MVVVYPGYATMFHAAIFAIALVAVQAQSQGPEGNRIRLLIVDGQNNHDWPRTTRILKDILESSGRFPAARCQVKPAHRRRSPARAGNIHLEIRL
jgi:hypothetical protein